MMTCQRSGGHRTVLDRNVVKLTCVFSDLTPGSSRHVTPITPTAFGPFQNGLQNCKYETDLMTSRLLIVFDGAVVEQRLDPGPCFGSSCGCLSACALSLQ